MNKSQSTLYYYGDDSLLAQLKAGKLNISQDWSMLEPYISFDRWHEGNVQIITEQELLAGLRFEFEKLPENIQQLLPFDDFLKQRDKLEAGVRARILEDRTSEVQGYQRQRLNNAGYLRLFSSALSHFGWQSLANNYQGICLAIKRSATSFQSQAGRPLALQPVQYGKAHALFADATNRVPGAFNDAQEHAERGEWRMVIPVNKSQLPVFKLHKDDVIEIYVSVHASPALVESLKALVNLDLRFRRTRLMAVFPDATKWRLTARTIHG